MDSEQEKGIITYQEKIGNYNSGDSIDICLPIITYQEK